MIIKRHCAFLGRPCSGEEHEKTPVRDTTLDSTCQMQVIRDSAVAETTRKSIAKSTTSCQDSHPSFSLRVPMDVY